MYGVLQLSYDPSTANKLTSRSSNLQQYIYTCSKFVLLFHISTLFHFPLSLSTVHECERRRLLDYFSNRFSFCHTVWREAPFCAHGRRGWQTNDLATVPCLHRYTDRSTPARTTSHCGRERRGTSCIRRWQSPLRA